MQKLLTKIIYLKTFLLQNVYQRAFHLMKKKDSTYEDNKLKYLYILTWKLGCKTSYI